MVIPVGRSTADGTGNCVAAVRAVGHCNDALALIE